MCGVQRLPLARFGESFATPFFGDGIHLGYLNSTSKIGQVTASLIRTYMTFLSFFSWLPPYEMHLRISRFRSAG